LVGAGIRHFMNVKSNLALSAAIALAFGIFFYTKPAEQPAQVPGAAAVSFSQVQPIFQQRCAACHSAHPSDDVFKVAPLGAMFDTRDQIKAYGPKIQSRAVVSKDMPLGNKTGITEAERKLIGDWIAGGMKD
ncbi:MAG TPA: hypothetical protein V6D23_05550, partial [Candidatus Obscuribacterales bacterium]